MIEKALSPGMRDSAFFYHLSSQHTVGHGVDHIGCIGNGQVVGDNHHAVASLMG